MEGMAFDDVRIFGEAGQKYRDWIDQHPDVFQKQKECPSYVPDELVKMVLADLPDVLPENAAHCVGNLVRDMGAGK